MNKSDIPRTKTVRKSRFSRAQKRLRELERILAIRHGGHVPETDDADYYLVPIANCFRKIAADCGDPERLKRLFQFWCSEHAPDIPDEAVASIASEALTGPAYLIPDDEVGGMVRLSYAERLKLRITAIGAFDVDRAARRKLAKGRKRERDRTQAKERRKANGATPREESLSRTEPWKAEGISRSTWERRRKKAASVHDANSSPHQPTDGDANLSPHQSSIRGRRICVRTPDSAERPSATAQSTIEVPPTGGFARATPPLTQPYLT